MSVFIVNPCLEMISVGKKLFAKKEQRGHGNFSGFPQIVDAPFKKKMMQFSSGGMGHDRSCPPNKKG